jgi:Zn-dependent peptidase ImmA (M78 family)
VPSAVAELRRLAPRRPLPPWTARSVAERQASRLLRLSGVSEPPVPEFVIEDLPRVEVHYRARRGLSGTTKWSDGRWVILINRSDTWGRQRFSLAHEFKHLLDWPQADDLYRDGFRSAHFQRERAADAFAATFLMPKTWLKRAFYDQGIRDEFQLARYFQVSVAAMRFRLDELKLFEPTKRVAA